MPKINKESDGEGKDLKISNEMMQKCKADIGKFGFTLVEYDKFLISVLALKKDSKTVLQYPNQQMETYRAQFLKKNENSLSDAFVLDKFKIKTRSGDGIKVLIYETGYFCPRSFWDYVFNERIS